MKARLFYTGLLALVTMACQPQQQGEPFAQDQTVFASRIEHSEPLISTIAFGSCANQDLPQQPALAIAAEKNPDLFVFLGDNIYSDTYEMDTLSLEILLGEIGHTLSTDDDGRVLRIEVEDSGANLAVRETKLEVQ